MDPVPEVVDIAEESRRYPDEWVPFEATDVDGSDEPMKGRLLCHSRSRDEIRDTAMRHRGAGLGLLTESVGDPVPPDAYVVL